MKLATDIKPRATGEVSVSAPGAKYVFKPGKDGRLVANVKDDADIAFLLDTGNFFPADEADIEKGIKAAKQAVEAAESTEDTGEIEE